MVSVIVPTTTSPATTMMEIAALKLALMAITPAEAVVMIARIPTLSVGTTSSNPGDITWEMVNATTS